MNIAVLGGGPIGVEAALYGLTLGHEVTLFEKGGLCHNVRKWGFVGVFTEWGRNISPLARRLLEVRGVSLPDPKTYGTGYEVARYIEQVAALPGLCGHIRLGAQVRSITREKCLKSDFATNPERRAEFPFRLLIGEAGVEHIERFDAVLDATGVYESPNWGGNGGGPCAGETALRAAAAIDYKLPDVEGTDRARFLGRHTVVVGAGHSAASTCLAIGHLHVEDPKTRLTWVVRRGIASTGEVYVLDPGDKLSGRRRLAERANALIREEHVEFLPSHVLEAVERRGDEFQVSLNGGRQVRCHNLAVHTGFRPNPNLWHELALAVHPATEGPLGLSEAILEGNRLAGVGLSTGYLEKLQPETTDIRAAEQVLSPHSLVRTTEPNFFVLGIKSYGRDAGFLMQNGFRQVREVYRLLAHDPGLDLYGQDLEE